MEALLPCGQPSYFSPGDHQRGIVVGSGDGDEMQRMRTDRHRQANEMNAETDVGKLVCGPHFNKGKFVFSHFIVPWMDILLAAVFCGKLG